MNVLEKILEEIKDHAIEFESFGMCDDYVSVGWVKEIMRSHMNHNGDDTEMDGWGWIPVSERLPNEREFQEAYCRNHYAAEFLVTIKGADRATTLYFKNNSWFDEERNYYEITAWQPLPEAYKGGTR